MQVLIVHLPADSHTTRAASGGMWDLTDQLLAGIYDLLSAANWQRAGNKRAKRPKPLPRPGVDHGGKRFGNKSMSIDEWRKHRARREGVPDGDRAGNRVRLDRPVHPRAR